MKSPVEYSFLALSTARRYPQRIIKESPNACSAAASFFKMPLPEQKETGISNVKNALSYFITRIER